MDGLFGDGLVDDVLFCGGDSLEEDLRWGPRLGTLVDLVELERSFELKVGIFAQRAMLDQACEGLCCHRETYHFGILNNEKFARSVLMGFILRKLLFSCFY